MKHITIVYSIGKGLPQERKRNTKTVTVPPQIIPSAQDAASMYRGTLTVWPEFGRDPLQDHVKKNQRDQLYSTHFPQFDVLFSQLANGYPTTFRQAVLYYINITKILNQTP